jgi:undecaprenyl-diphosphatase
MNVFQAFVLGIVEGLTEFIPVSSTGHLILSAYLLGIPQTPFQKSFEIIIQLGAILAVVFVYREKLMKNLKLWKKLIVAFVPTGVIGLLFHDFFKSSFNAKITSTMLIAWGIVFIAVELLKVSDRAKTRSVENVSYIQAFFVGVFQSFALIPGTSRSGATIIGGMLLGMDRITATEFSFLLAVPTMFSATVYEAAKGFEISEVGLILVGFLTSMIFAFVSIKFLLTFLKTHSLVPFGIYRIIVGSIFRHL